MYLPQDIEWEKNIGPHSVDIQVVSYADDIDQQVQSQDKLTDSTTE